MILKYNKEKTERGKNYGNRKTTGRHGSHHDSGAGTGIH